MRGKIIFIVGLSIGLFWVLTGIPAAQLEPLAGLERINLSATPQTPSENPRIAVDGAGGIYIVWSDKLADNFEIAMRRCSIEEGQLSCNPPLGEPPVNLSETKGASKLPDLALLVPGMGLVVWEESVAGASRIFLKRFTVAAEGTIQPSPDTFDVSERPGAKRPAIAIDRQGRSFVVWEQAADQFGGNMEIYFRASTPFAEKINISNSSPHSRDAAIAIDTLGKVYVSWQEGGDFDNAEIFFTQSANAGEEFVMPSFDPPANISGPNSPGQSLEPMIAIEGPGVQLVVWSDNTRRDDNPEGDYEIFLRRSTDAFALPVNVSGSCKQGSKVDSRHPAVAVDGLGNVYVAWQEGREVWIAVSEFRTRDTLECLPLSTPGKAAGRPAIALDQLGNALVVWEEVDEGGNKEILFTALKIAR